MQQTASSALFQHLASLTEGFFRLGAQLSQAAKELQTSGVPPHENLLAELAAARRDFTDLCTRGLTLAESLAIAPLPASDALVSLSDLKALLQSGARAEEQKAAVEDLQQRALRVLDRVLAIGHREGITFEPLLECQARAGTLRLEVAEARWPDLHPATEALADGEDPFSDLLTLVEHQAELDDDRWALLQDTVEQSFGKPLATAASRGKFTIAEDAVAETSAAGQSAESPAPADPPQEAVLSGDSAVTMDSLAVPAEMVAEEAEEMLPLTAPESASVPGKLAARDAAAMLFPLDSEERKSEETLLLRPLYRFGLDDTAQKIAAALLQNGATNKERPAILRDLIWRLLFEDKISLAFHLARCLETQYPHCQPRLPSWLLRAVVLGRRVRHANGEIALFLKEDFAQFSPDAYVVGHPEWDRAVGFLLLAAALQPALLAPHTHASALLHAVRPEEGLPQLAEYCSLVAEYGDKLQALDPQVLKKGKEQAAWQTEVDALKQAVEMWSIRAPRMALAFTPAAKVWSKWLEPKGLISSLLLFVRQNDLSRLPLAKRAVEQFSDDAQCKREVDRTDRDVLGRRLGDDITGRALEQLRTHTREAVGLVRRWIELQESRLGQRKGSVQEQGEQLRQEVWSRHEAVIEELSLFKRRNPSPLTLSSLACCRKVLENIHTLFDPEASFPTEEPLPRPLLYADLLRIPSLVLNEQWEVEDSNRDALVDGIVEVVANGAPKKAVA